MKKRKYYPGILALAAVLAVASAGIGRAWSYFTTYTETAGGYPIRLGDWTEITEDFSSWTKEVTITNAPGSEPVYIRVKAFYVSPYTVDDSGEGWTLNEADGYYYYNNPVAGGGATTTLYLKIEGISKEPEELESFNVIVVYESIPVKYDEEGNAIDAMEMDWNETLDIGKTEASGSVVGSTGMEVPGDTEAGSDAEDSGYIGTDNDAEDNGGTENPENAEDGTGTDTVEGTEGGDEA